MHAGRWRAVQAHGMALCGAAPWSPPQKSPAQASACCLRSCSTAAEVWATGADGPSAIQVWAPAHPHGPLPPSAPAPAPPAPPRLRGPQRVLAACPRAGSPPCSAAGWGGDLFRAPIWVARPQLRAVQAPGAPQLGAHLVLASPLGGLPPGVIAVAALHGALVVRPTVALHRSPAGTSLGGQRPTTKVQRGPNRQQLSGRAAYGQPGFQK